MLNEWLYSEAVQKALMILKTEFPLAIWETLYVTILSTAFATLIGLPLGVLLVAGENGRILRVPKAILQGINILINLLRSVPFLILMIMVIPLTRLLIGTVVGTPATVVPLVIAAFPFIARLVESSLRGRPEHYRGSPKHGSLSFSNHRKSNASRKRSLFDLQ